jgi:hypothetical protein
MCTNKWTVSLFVSFDSALSLGASANEVLVSVAEGLRKSIHVSRE